MPGIYSTPRTHLALSVRQPWAWLIVNGYKTVEDRTWYTAHRGPLLIHAGLTIDLDRDDYAWLVAEALEDEDHVIIPDYDTVQTGGIIGIVDLVDVTRTPTEPDDIGWHEGDCWAWILRNPRVLPYQPMPGKLRLFKVPPGIITLPR